MLLNGEPRLLAVIVCEAEIILIFADQAKRDVKDSLLLIVCRVNIVSVSCS